MALYRGLAENAEGEHREILLELAAAEERHARYWQAKLRELGIAVPAAEEHRPRLSARWTSWLGRRLGVRRVVPLLERVEASERIRYDAEPGVSTAMAADESAHARLVASLAPTWRAEASSSFRAAVFGVNDGLVSNLSLVMGMAGGKASTTVVLLAGIAGLVAGAGSMAAGEYISVKSQRELLEAQLVLGGSEPPATTAMAPAAGRITANPVNFDPAVFGSPIGAAVFSFAAFAVGAAVPLLPFIAASGTAALITAAILAAAALFLAGAGISIVTQRAAVASGFRQLLVGSVAAAGTYVIGLLVGTSLL